MYIVTADAVGPNKIAVERGLEPIQPFQRKVANREEAVVMVTMMSFEICTRYGFSIDVDPDVQPTDEQFNVYAKLGDEVMFHLHATPDYGTASVS